jgi:hypothetical protein
LNHTEILSEQKVSQPLELGLDERYFDFEEEQLCWESQQWETLYPHQSCSKRTIERMLEKGSHVVPEITRTQ